MKRKNVVAQATLYLAGHGSEERMNLETLHDYGDGVVAVMRCFKLHQKHLLPQNIDFCKELDSRYNNYDYEGLMNTTFGLVPAGRQPGSFRLGEVRHEQRRGSLTGDFDTHALN